MAEVLKKELKKLHDYLQVHHVVEKIEKSLEVILKFIKDHIDVVYELLKAVKSSIQHDSGTPLRKDLQKMTDFPAHPTVKNVMEWITDDLSPVLIQLLETLKKSFPDKATAIGHVESVLKGVDSVLKFLENVL